MSTPFLGELKLIGWNFPPKGWSFCNGQLLPINQNQALFSLLGTTYGGNGQTTFALPDLRGRAPLHFGQGIQQGVKAGEEFHTLTQGEMPAHTHQLMADGTTIAGNNAASPAAGNAIGQSIGVPSQGSPFAVSVYSNTLTNPVAAAGAEVGIYGGSQPHENRQPFLVMNWIIALIGIFPTRN